MKPWFHQIIPQGCQLLHFFNELQRICIEDNKDNPEYDYELEDDSFEGHITWSSKGVHFAHSCEGFFQTYGYEWGFDWGFQDDVFFPSFNSELQIREGGVPLNAFTHAAGLEVDVFLNSSLFNTGNHTEEHDGDPQACTILGTTPVPTEFTLEKVTRLEKMSDSTKTANDLAPTGLNSSVFNTVNHTEEHDGDPRACTILGTTPAPADLALAKKILHGSKRCQTLPRRLTILFPRTNFFAKLFRWDFGISTCLHQRFSPRSKLLHFLMG